ncbi:MAG: radical SAM protein, partial [Candidatus Omnitrophica bacterium]|nr:radical SAM protein [Candidatus Omnitrophota bacterium]
YQNIIVDKNPRRYFDSLAIEKFSLLQNVFTGVYLYYLRELNYSKLKIVERYLAEIIQTNPRYIGFSLQGDFDLFSRIIRKGLKKLTAAPIIIGGSLTPFLDLKQLDQTFARECFDYLVIGSGELALPSLLEALENKTEPKGIANVFYKKANKVTGNELAVIDDLDQLPYPDYSQFDLDLYLTPKRILPLQTARGCSWRKCAFCAHHRVYLGSYRTLSIKRVIESIEHLQNSYNCQHLTLHDEELSATRAKRISQAIFSRGLTGLSLYAYARLSREYNNSRFLSRLRKAGFAAFAWGLESGCQRVLDSIGKGTELSVMSQILKKSAACRIASLCFAIFGFPGETRPEAQQTVEFLKKHAQYIDEIIFQCFALESNSPIGKNPEKWGVSISSDGSFSTKTGMNRQEARNFGQEFQIKYRLNSIKVTADKFRYLPECQLRRMLHFLNSSYNLLPKATLLDCIKRKQLGSIFPIIVGKIENRGSRTVFYPADIKESCFINQLCPKKEKTLGDLEQKIFVLADGRLSIEDIISTACRDFKSKHSISHIRNKCIDSLQTAFSKDWALGFAKSWAAKSIYPSLPT